MSVLPDVSIACDESGNDGENVLSGGSPVFVHASVALSLAEAAKLMKEIRHRTRSRSEELKSKTLVQSKHQDTARCFLKHLGECSKAGVHLTHKRYFLVCKLFDSTVEELANDSGEDMYANGRALTGATLLYYLAPRYYGDDWNYLLAEFQKFLRSNTPADAQNNLKRVEQRIKHLLQNRDAPIRGIIQSIYSGISYLTRLSTLQLGDDIKDRLRTGDPLLSAIGATIKHWSQDGSRTVHVVHDHSKILTAKRVVAIKEYLDRPEYVAPSLAGTGCVLTGLDLVDSKTDPRIQVADLLAGAARVATEDLIAGKIHPLLELIEPLLVDLTIWPRPEHVQVDVAKDNMLAYFSNFR